jgi:hypothetical protein
MSVNAVDNSNLKNYRDDQGTTGFTPSVAFAWDAEAKTIDVTDESEYPSGVALKKVAVRVFDNYGGEVRNTLAPAEGSGDDEVTVDVSTLNPAEGLSITATVIADDNKLVADGIAKNIMASGSLAYWDIQKNA